MQDFRKLNVWKKAHLLTLTIYKVTTHLPREEKYGLIQQMRRSSSSIATNIAEGTGRDTQSQLNHFLNISYGSASELDYQLLLSHDLNFINTEHYERLSLQVEEVKKMLWSFMQSIKTDN